MTDSRTIARPRPTLDLKHGWRWRGRGDVHGHRELRVRALYSHNENEVPAPDRADGHLLPNEIVVDLEQGQDRRSSTVRLDRAAAARLRDMLDDALSWDGVAP